jgi:LCP family protein required for cell wall assembly
MAVGLKEGGPSASAKPPSFSPLLSTQLSRRPKWPVWTKICVTLGAVLVILAGGVMSTVYGFSAQVERNVKRADILSDVPGQKSSYTEGPLNFLVLGSDNREADPTVKADTTGARADTIMLVHIDKSLTKASIVSIPRDSYVDIPAAGNGKWLGGKNKINAAYDFGGPALTAKTVNRLTGVPLNGAFLLDFNSVRKLVGIVGGVTVCIPFSMRSIHTDRVWKKGCNFLTADAAQDFMRQRKTVPGGDFGRIQNQQRVVLAVAKKLSVKGLITNPLRLNRLVTTVASAVTVDKSVDLPDLALGLKSINPGNLRFATPPIVTDNLQTPAGSSVQLDRTKGEELFSALRNDTMDEWFAANPTTSATVG